MYKINKNSNTYKNRATKKKLFFVLAALAIISVVLVALELTHKINLVSRPTKESSRVTSPGDSQSTANSDKGEQSGVTPETPQPSPTPNPENDKKDGVEPSPSAPLRTPTGTFVSNHRPNISGHPAPKTVQSVCTTTPGATCQIVFTKGGVTKTLPSQQTDKEGSAYWTWAVDDPSIGLGEGSWNVTAKATLGDQVKSAADPVLLEVKP